MNIGLMLALWLLLLVGSSSESRIKILVPDDMIQQQQPSPSRGP